MFVITLRWTITTTCRQKRNSTLAGQKKESQAARRAKGVEGTGLPTGPTYLTPVSETMNRSLYQGGETVQFTQTNKKKMNSCPTTPRGFGVLGDKRLAGPARERKATGHSLDTVVIPRR